MSFSLAIATPTAPSTWALQTWPAPFDYDSPGDTLAYTPTAKASTPWHLCIAYPHLKDAYWLNVNYGMVEEAKRLGVSFTLVEAGGYPNLERQREQIKACTEQGTDALIIGTVSYHALHSTIEKIATKMPVLATVNDIENQGITAKSGVSWYSMGKVTGAFLAQRHPKGSPEMNVAWFPGPKGAGWVNFIHRGFLEGISNSAVKIVVTKWGDTGKEIQRTLVQEALEINANLHYIVGNALMAEAAVSTLRNRQLSDNIKVISTYFTPAVYRGIRRGRILAAPNDAPVVQGRLSINQAVEILEGRDFLEHAGPAITLVTEDNWRELNIDHSLSPPSFSPEFYWPAP